MVLSGSDSKLIVIWIHYFVIYFFSLLLMMYMLFLNFRMSKRKYKLYLEPNNTIKIPCSRLKRRHLDVSLLMTHCATPLWYIKCFIILNVLPDYVLLRWQIVETTIHFKIYLRLWMVTTTMKKTESVLTWALQMLRWDGNMLFKYVVRCYLTLVLTTFSTVVVFVNLVLV